MSAVLDAQLPSSSRLPETTPLLRVSDLKTYFPVRKGLLRQTVGYVRAVDGISFEIGRGETLGLVGESGCGKTTAGRTILRLIDPTSGTIEFDGEEITELGRRKGSPLGEPDLAGIWRLRSLRPKMQIVFQDPYGSLNPRMTVRAIVEEGLLVHRMGKRRQRREKVVEILERVGLDSTALGRYPHEFSGGQRQRICIARALILQPQFVVLDEPISALDVSIQAQIINLLNDLRQEMNLTYLFISHDLSVVEYISDRVAVMYLGEIVELATSQEIYKNPQHPYTRALLSSIPSLDPQRKTQRIILKGDVPSPINPPSGCRFHPRCPLAFDRCSRESPQPLNLNGHMVRCHAVEEGRVDNPPVDEPGS